MKHFFSSCLFFLSVIHSPAQLNECSAKKYLINIDSLNNDLYHNNLTDSLFQNSSIVLLGEETHGDGTAFLLKKEIAEYLIKKHDFEVVLFESGFYDLNRMNDFEFTESDFKKNIYSVWANSIEFSGVYPLIKDNKITIGGFDSRNKGSFSNNLVKEVDSITILKKLYDVSNSKYIAFKATLNSLLRMEFQDTSSLKMKNNFYEVINTLEEKNRSDKNDWWAQEFRNIHHFGEQTWAQQKNENDYFKLRDQYMAENISWLKDNLYKNKKIIIWTANFHASNLNVPYLTAGSFLRKKYGSDLTCILSSAYQGQRRDGKDIVNIKKSGKNTFEYFLNDLGIENGVVVCSRICPELSDKKIMGLGKPSAILEITDAILFINTMKPSTLINK